VEQGDPGGTPVLLLHGYTDSWHSFDLVRPLLPGSMRVIAPSLRGHGTSDRPATGYTPSELASDVREFLDALHLPYAVIVGHSMGSTIAQRVAIDYPDRVLGLVLVATFKTHKGHDVIADLWNDGVSTLSDPIDPAFAREFQEKTLALPVSPAFFQTVVNESLRLPAHVWKAALKGLIESDFSNELSRISAPTFIVWGDGDLYLQRDDQEAIRDVIRGSTLAVYPEVGHAPHWEVPSRFARDLTEFVGRVVRG
jgi:pimeloyl-ACP methyl ester carboxylesterase